MIKFKCGQCGQKIGVPEAHAGKRGKCPKCGAVSVIPAPALAVVAASEEPPPYALTELAQQLRAQPSYDLSTASPERSASIRSLHDPAVEEAPLTGTERKIIRWGIAAGACLIVGLIASLVVPGQIQKAKENRLLAALESETASLVVRAEADAARFDFERAMTALNDAKQRVSGTSLPAERLQTVTGKVHAARQAIARSRDDYNQKLAGGYVLRSGVLVSPQDQAAEAARLEAERRRQAEIAQNSARQREEQHRRQREEKEAARLVETTRQQEEQKRRLANDPTALAQDFEQFVRRLAAVLKHEPDDAVFLDLKFDLRKTDSLVNPHVGVVEWREVFRKTMENGEYAFYKHAIVHFSYKDGKWTPVSYSQGTHGHGKLLGKYNRYADIPKFVSKATAEAQ